VTRDVPHSSHWGAFIAQVADGEVTAVRGFPGDPEPSPLIESVPDALSSSARVAAPAVRKGWLEEGPGASSHRRGADAFVTVPWPEAIRLVAGELARVRREHGNAAIFGGSYGWASAGRFHHAKTQLERFLNVFGGCTAQIGNYSYAAGSAILPHVVGSAGPTAGEVTGWESIIGHTRLWVMFGGAPLKNAQVESGGTARHGVAQQLRKARAAGVEFVGVTPQRSDLADFLGAEWIAPRPNTDTAIMLGIAHTLLDEGLADLAFLDRYCVGWEQLRGYLTGAQDGRPKTADWAAAIADVDAGTLRTLARRMAAQRTLISTTWSLQRADHGEQPFWMTIALAAMLGQIGLDGGGFGFGYTNVAGIGSAKSPFGVPVMPSGHNPARSSIPVARIADMLLHPGERYDFNGASRSYPDIRLVYWAGGNPFHHHQDINRLIDAWRRPQTVVVHEPWWTATARHADIVLPATTTLERNDIGAASRELHVIAMQQAVPPAGAARNDHDIFADLARQLDVEQAFTEGLDEMGWLTRIYENFRDRAQARRVELPTFAQFWQRGHVELATPPGHVLLGDFRADPDRHRLHTPSGRIELFSATIAGFGYPDCPGHPAWLEPAEWLGAPQAASFPLHLISNQPQTRLHGQLDMGRVSLASKVAGREPVKMNTADATARGIRDGDVVIIRNARGRCLAGARVDDTIRRGVIQIATGAWYDPAQPGRTGTLDKHGNPNVLTADHGTSRLGQGPSAQSALVEVELLRTDPPPVTAFDPPVMETAQATTDKEPRDDE
jgi:biotin/methionine sulfoxide reductase